MVIYMKKVILALVASSVLAFASESTVSATMSLMTQGLNQIQNGFIHSNDKDVAQGIEILESANAIFTQVDVATFIPQSNKVQVTKNINKNLTVDLKALKKAFAARNYTDTTKEYGKVVANCIACHRIVRGW